MNTRTNKNPVPVIVIFAPTASGKTALTKELFSESGSHFILKGEIVSADSQQVYKGMDIGTAKADAQFCKCIPHHLINLLSPHEQWNVSDFVDSADKACLDIYERGKIPVVCGGTGFYIRNFLYGVPPTPESDSVLRSQLKERIAREGNEALYRELKALDSESAAKIHVNDAYRICRALEVYYLTGKTRSSYASENKLREKYNFVFIVLEPPRELLYERIRMRVDQMFEDGLEEEVKNLIAGGCGADTPGMKAIGYSEWFDLEKPGKLRPADIVREEIKHHSCKYAKKQYTYIRDIPGSIRVEYSGSDEEIEQIADIIRKKLL